MHFVVDPANLHAPSLLTSLASSHTVGTPSLASYTLVSTRTSTPLSYLGLGTLWAWGPPLVLGMHLSTDSYVSPWNSVPPVGPPCPPPHLTEFRAGPRTLVSTSGTLNLVHHPGLRSAPGTSVHSGLLTTRTITSFRGLPYLTPCRAPVTPRPSISLLGNTGTRK